MPYTINGFPSSLVAINKKRSAKGERTVLEKDWATFLSGFGNSVKKDWIKKCKNGEGVPSQDKAVDLLSALNACLKAHGIKMLVPDDVIIAV